MEEKQAYNLSINELFEKHNTGKEGLTEEEAKKRFEEFGPNELETKEEKSKVLMFLSQFKDVLVIILLVAALMSLFIQNYSDAAIMLLIVIINAAIGFFQEFKAEQILNKLKNLIQSPAKVIRDGEQKEINQTDLVVGDLVLLDEGDKVPADLRIIQAYNLKTNDFSLTGESMPQEKQNKKIEKNVPLGDRDNMAYLGTNVASGNGRGIVVQTAMDTELGKIANLTQEEDTTMSPLQREFLQLANQLALVAVVVGVVLFGTAYNQGFTLLTALTYGLGVAVAVVPQALPAQVSVALSQGSNRLAEKKAVVKKLSSVETLGSTTIICTDKTGTLTKNEMTVRSVYFNQRFYDITGLGYEPKGTILDDDGKELNQEQIDEIEIMLDAATMASNAEIHEPDEEHKTWYAIGDPTEAALITASTKLGTRSPIEDEENPELHEFPFDSFRKRMSSVREFDEGERQVLCMKGAPDGILEIAKYIYKDGQVKKMTPEDIREIELAYESYSKEAMRVLAIAYRELDPNGKDYDIEEVERDVTFLGLMAMIDPPKEGVAEAIKAAHDAHIRTFIMTGDHAITAQAIGKEIGLDPEGGEVAIITGQELGNLSDDRLRELMRENDELIFSRVSPEDKLRVVKNLKLEQEIVAVTGDGVNDAPALKNAHIGVAMGTMGTDVAKEASELVLLDDSYVTLVDAVREGRIIYNNLKKTVLASMTTNGAELATVVLGLIAVALWGHPIPILAIQILAIDLFAEIMPLTALTFDPGAEALMKLPPRNQDDHIINKRSGVEVIYLGLLIGGLAFANFELFMARSGGIIEVGTEAYARGTTITYLTIAFCQFANIMSRRYEYETIFSKNFFSNKIILASLGISISLVLIAINTPLIQNFLSFASISLLDWGYVLGAAFILLINHEIIKIFKKKSLENM
ncbi:MAG: cation-translocating P-type ATPase [Clostridia bacterium]